MESAIVIPVMGASGVGKSTFINILLQHENLGQELMGVGKTLSPHTKDLQMAKIEPHFVYPNHSIFLVDTPGFDTREGDEKILQQIADKFKSPSDGKKLAFGGVIYLYDISRDRWNDTIHKNLEKLYRMCGVKAFNGVVIGTTKWDRIHLRIEQERVAEIKEGQCKAMLEKGARVFEQRENMKYDSARRLVNLVLDDVPTELEHSIVIPVMGPTGAGKSTFINIFLQHENLGQKLMSVGNTLSSCTKDLEIARVKPHPDYPNRSIFLVDTPGFDDTYEEDADILRRIATWLRSSYDDKTLVLGGVIYLHDISQSRFSGTARRNLEMFHRICGEQAMDRVVIGTTMWGGIDKDIGLRRETELKDVHWKAMLDKGTMVSAHHKDMKYGTARALVDLILKRFHLNKSTGAVLEIQTELAVDRKLLPETQAAQQLRYTLQQVRDTQKEIADAEKAFAKAGDLQAKVRVEEAQMKKEVLDKQIKELRLSIGQKFMKFIRH